MSLGDAASGGVGSAVTAALRGASTERRDQPERDKLEQRAPRAPGGDAASRLRLWQIPIRYHCSLLGVCLDLEEMRRLAARLGLPASSEVADFEVHHNIVYQAGFADRAGRRLNRFLENKYAAWVRRFRSCRDEAAVRAAWQRSREAGDLAGAYWALLTHPCASSALRAEAHAYVHMFSHRAAAEMRQMQARAQRLQARLADAQERLRRERAAREREAGRRERARRAAERADELAREVVRLQARNRALEEAARPPVAAQPGTDEDALIADLKARLDQAQSQAQSWRHLCRRALRRNRAAGVVCAHDPRADPCVDAQQRATHEQPGDERSCHRACDLGGRCVVYVGGHDRVVPRLRSITESCNGRFVHHDGGISERPGLIDDQVAGSDLVMVPLDCVSHDACRRLKRCCRRAGTPIVWLRSASVSAYEAALAQVAR